MPVACVGAPHVARDSDMEALRVLAIESLHMGRRLKRGKIRLHAREPFQVFAPLRNLQRLVKAVGALGHASQKACQNALVDAREHVGGLQLNERDFRETLRKAAKPLGVASELEQHDERFFIAHPGSHYIEARLAMRDRDPALEAFKELAGQLRGQRREQKMRGEVIAREQIAVVTDSFRNERRE